MSGSFESVRWNACVHGLDLGLYSHPKDFGGNGVRNHVNSKGKIPSTGGSEEGRTHNTASRTTANQHTTKLLESLGQYLEVTPPDSWTTRTVSDCWLHTVTG